MSFPDSAGVSLLVHALFLARQFVSLEFNNTPMAATVDFLHSCETSPISSTPLTSKFIAFMNAVSHTGTVRRVSALTPKSTTLGRPRISQTSAYRVAPTLPATMRPRERLRSFSSHLSESSTGYTLDHSPPSPLPTSAAQLVYTCCFHIYWTLSVPRIVCRQDVVYRDFEGQRGRRIRDGKARK